MAQINRAVWRRAATRTGGGSGSSAGAACARASPTCRARHALLGERSERRVRMGQFYSGVGYRRNLTGGLVSLQPPAGGLLRSDALVRDRAQQGVHWLVWFGLGWVWVWVWVWGSVRERSEYQLERLFGEIDRYREVCAHTYCTTYCRSAAC